MRIINLSYLSIPDLAGHDVLHTGITDIIKVGWDRAIADFKVWGPDLIIEREWNDSIALYEPIYKAFPDVKKAWWWIDAHVNLYHRMSYARNFDYIFMAVSRFIPETIEGLRHNRVFWLPLCWSHGPIVMNEAPKEFEVTFVCRWTPENLFAKRIACIKRLRDHFGSRLYVVNSADMINIVRRSRISMNHCYDNDLNFRYFEVMGCGTELVTNPCEDLYKIQGMADRLTVYHDLDEMIDLTEAVLADRIHHDQGEVQRWIAASHTLEHRYRTILDTIWGEAKGYEPKALSD